MAPTREELTRLGLEGAPQYTPEEEQRLTANLLSLLRRVHVGEFSNAQVDVRLLCDLHRGIFTGVRDHAGTCRSRHFGSERLAYGPNRSSHRNDVPLQLDRLFERVLVSLRSLEQSADDPAYDGSAMHVAVWTHAEVIRVHPFEDGNGRSSRALMDLLLVRLGLRPIPIDAPKQEYLDCLNHYFGGGGIDRLVDLCLRLYPLDDPDEGRPGSSGRG